MFLYRLGFVWYAVIISNFGRQSVLGSFFFLIGRCNNSVGLWDSLFVAKMVGKMMELFFNSNQKVSISYNRLSPPRRCGGRWPTLLFSSWGAAHKLCDRYFPPLSIVDNEIAAWLWHAIFTAYRVVYACRRHSLCTTPNLQHTDGGKNDSNSNYLQ